MGQDRAKMAQDGPKMGQDGPKTALRWPKLAPIRPEDGTKLAPSWPKMAQYGPKMAPRWRKKAPRWPKMAPKWPWHVAGPGALHLALTICSSCRVYCIRAFVCCVRQAMWVDTPAALQRQTLLLLILCGILYKYACSKASDCQAVVEAVRSGKEAGISATALMRVFLVADRMYAKAGAATAVQHILDDERWSFTATRMERLRRVLQRLPSASRRKMIGSFGLNSGDLWVRAFTPAGVHIRSTQSAKSVKSANKFTTRFAKSAESAKSTKKAIKPTKKSIKKVIKVDAAAATKRCKELEELAAGLVEFGLFSKKLLLWHDIYKKALKVHMYGAYGAVRLARNASLVRQSMGLPVLIEDEHAWRAILRMHKNVQSAGKLLGLDESNVSFAKDMAEQIEQMVTKFNKGGAAFRTNHITLGCMAILACEYDCVLRKAHHLRVKCAASAASAQDDEDDDDEHRLSAAKWLWRCLPQSEDGVRQLRRRVLAAMFRSPDACSGWDRCSAVSSLTWLHAKNMLKPASDVSVKPPRPWFLVLVRSQNDEDSILSVSSESDESAQSAESSDVEVVVESAESADESEMQVVESESDVQLVENESDEQGELIWSL